MATTPHPTIATVAAISGVTRVPAAAMTAPSRASAPAAMTPSPAAASDKASGGEVWIASGESTVSQFGGKGVPESTQAGQDASGIGAYGDAPDTQAASTAQPSQDAMG